MRKLWEIIILVLSLYVVVLFGYELIIPIPPHLIFLFDRIDTIICLLFLGDFFFFLFKSDNKPLYFKRNWLELVSSIPFVEFFRVFRMARILRIAKFFELLKLLRGFNGIFHCIMYLKKNKLRSILFSYVALLIAVVLYCSAAFYVCERGANKLVHSYFDALWWAFITVTSVGYGDIYPKTLEGRLIAMVLTLFGMGLFALIIAEGSAKFAKYLADAEKEQHDQDHKTGDRL